MLATWLDTVEPQALDDLRLLLGTPLQLVRASEHDVRSAIRRIYSPDALTAEDVIAGMSNDVRPTGELNAALDDLVSLANEAPVVKLVNLLLLEALEARASDVHLETYQGGLRIRYRIDGVLQDAASPPRRLAAAVVSRLKIMAELDIAERRVPQDGRIRLRMRDRQVDVRVATLPTLHGESVVLRSARQGTRPHRAWKSSAWRGDTRDALPGCDQTATRHRAVHRVHRIRQNHHAVCSGRSHSHRPAKKSSRWKIRSNTSCPACRRCR